jgi:hypothetical protein
MRRRVDAGDAGKALKPGVALRQGRYLLKNMS